MKSKYKYNNLTAALILLVLVFTQFVNPESALASRICDAVNSNIYYVDANSTFVGPDGCSWETAYETLQDALADPTLASGDEIWVAAGTYYPDEGAGQINDNRNSVFTLKNGVNIYGGFLGTETLRTQRDPLLHATILGGDIGTVGVNTDNVYHVVWAVDITSVTQLDGFTIRDGYSDDGTDFGGGIYINNSNANLQLTGLTISNNFAGNGGGVATFVSNPVLTRVTFSGNTARQYGGGWYNQDGSPVLVDVIFDNNQTLQSASPGGGMHNSNTNTAVYTVTPVLTNVTFSNNRALAGGGGGMFNFQSHAVLTNVTFSGNNAFVRGGAILNEGSNVVFNNVTFSGNTAPAGTGGAMRNIYAHLPNDVVVPSNPVVRNSILWGNGSEEIVNDTGSSVTIYDSVVMGGCPALGTCTDFVTTNPNLVALANNGGFTQTMALGVGSSAIDIGDNLTCATTDQIGTARPQGMACDAGAYEAMLPPVAFSKGSPADGLTGVAANPILNWLPSSGMDYYEYCYDTTDNDSCSNWITTSVRKNTLSGLTPNTTYYWQSRAVNTTGTTYANGSETSYWSFTTANVPGPFGKAVLANGTTGASINPTLTWGGSSEATTYEYCYDTTNDGACSGWSNNGGARNVTLSGLTSNTTYYWQVRASNTFGVIYANGAETAYWSFTTVNPPGAFGKAVLVNGTTGASLTPTLTWGGGSGASSYEYCYDTTNDGACSVWTSTGGARNVTLSGLASATTYYWQVRARNSAGLTYANGAETAYWSFTTITPPGAFGKAVLANGTTGAFLTPTLTWGAGSQATSYEYCYDTTNDGACSVWTSTGGARNVTLSGLSPATTYYWQVRAINSVGITYANGAENAYWSFTTITPPGAFSKAVLANGTTGASINPTLTWGGSSGASSYEYCYDTTNDGACSVWTNTGGARNVTLSGLTPGVSYYWQVRAKNSVGLTYANGAETAYWSFTTVNLPGAFGKGTPANGSTGLSVNPTLIWGPSSGVSSYEYCYDTTDDGACGTWVSVGGARNVTLSGLTPGATYYWQVRAKNSVGVTYANGSETAYWTFTIKP